MCGIVGYVGSTEAVDFLITGLRRLEYRGYDSAGIATITPANNLVIAKSVGRIERLEQQMAETPVQGNIGIGHTRWATHGSPTLANAHPQLGGDGIVAVAHNGVIENFLPLRSRLEAEGFTFTSDTDTEVIAHLVAGALAKQPPVEDMAAAGYEPLVAAVQAALSQLQGTYGLVLLFRDWPDVMIAA